MYVHYTSEFKIKLLTKQPNYESVRFWFDGTIYENNLTCHAGIKFKYIPEIVRSFGLSSVSALDAKKKRAWRCHPHAMLKARALELCIDATGIMKNLFFHDVPENTAIILTPNERPL